MNWAQATVSACSLRRVAQRLSVASFTVLLLLSAKSAPSVVPGVGSLLPLGLYEGSLTLIVCDQPSNVSSMVSEDTFPAVPTFHSLTRRLQTSKPCTLMTPTSGTPVPSGLAAVCRSRLSAQRTSSVYSLRLAHAGLAILSAIITFFFVRPIDHDGMEDEDRKVGFILFVRLRPFPLSWLTSC